MSRSGLKAGWVPKQYGAWPMLIVPLVVGLLIRHHDGAGPAPYALPLGACWLLGYLAFNAVAGWMKAAPSRRPEFVAPIATYVAASAVFGVITVAMAGWPILGWVPFFAVLLVPALLLIHRRRERATVTGALTLAAASLMTLVARFDSPAELSWTPMVQHALTVTALVFAYFFGTVLYVKTNIRERRNPAFYTASVAWHAAWTLLAALGSAVTWLSPAWTLLFAALTARAAVVPRLRPPWTPKRIGFIEVGVCVVIGLIAALA